MTQRSLTVHPCGCLTLYCFRQRSSIHEVEYQADLKHLLFSPMLRGGKNCFPQFFCVCFIYVRRFPDVAEARWNTVAKPPNVVKVCCERRQGVFWPHQGCKLAFQPHRSNNTQSIGLSFLFSTEHAHATSYLHKTPTLRSPWQGWHGFSGDHSSFLHGTFFQPV